jgi:dTDP-4-amino-4,6-dideoxygalactose transaminase
LIPKGIIPVDLFGLPADYDAVNAIANEHDLFVLEDAAQSFGAEYKGKKACGLAGIAATSFFPAKPLGCYGDGGAVFTGDDHVAGVLTSLRVHGKGERKYENVRIGINGRMDTLQAAVLLAKMEIFPEEVELRQEVAHRYTEGLKGAVETPYIPENCRSAWAQYSVLSDRREELTVRLTQAGIPTAVYYPKPLHRQEAFASLGYEPGSMPVAEHTAERVFSVPMHSYLDEAEQGKVVSAITNVATPVAKENQQWSLPTQSSMQ